MKPYFLGPSILLAAWFALAPSATRGQSQSQSAAPQPSDSATALPKAPAQTSAATDRKPVKIWTNDDVDTLRNNQSVSVVGANPRIKKTIASSVPLSNEKDSAWYRKQLAPLRTEIDKLDAQIEKTKAFIDGENVGEPIPYHHNNVPVSPADQLKQFETKRQTDQTKIDDLLDRARHNGIEPGALR